MLATCAGLILAARQVSAPSQDCFGWLDIDVQRNGWGRQQDSFEARSDDDHHPLVFIRAPRIVEVGPDVEVLVRFRGEPVAVQGGTVVGCSFHPELTTDSTLHQAVFGRGD